MTVIGSYRSIQPQNMLSDPQKATRVKKAIGKLGGTFHTTSKQKGYFTGLIPDGRFTNGTSSLGFLPDGKTPSGVYASDTLDLKIAFGLHLSDKQVWNTAIETLQDYALVYQYLRERFDWFHIEQQLEVDSFGPERINDLYTSKIGQNNRDEMIRALKDLGFTDKVLFWGCGDKVHGLSANDPTDDPILRQSPDLVSTREQIALASSFALTFLGDEQSFDFILNSVNLQMIMRNRFAEKIDRYGITGQQIALLRSNYDPDVFHSKIADWLSHKELATRGHLPYISHGETLEVGKDRIKLYLNENYICLKDCNTRFEMHLNKNQSGVERITLTGPIDEHYVQPTLFFTLGDSESLNYWDLDDEKLVPEIQEKAISLSQNILRTIKEGNHEQVLIENILEIIKFFLYSRNAFQLPTSDHSNTEEKLLRVSNSNSEASTTNTETWDSRLKKPLLDWINNLFNIYKFNL